MPIGKAIFETVISLQALSSLLLQGPNAESFKQMSPEDALTWLQNDDGVAAQRFRALRARHAHRCYKELDVYSKTWDIDSIPLVQTLQSNVRSGEQFDRKKEDDRMTVDQLPKQPSFMQRKLLNYFISRAKYAVYAREATKSAFVKGVHQVRLSIRKIGLQLQAEGRLRDPELVFFFTCDELYRFIKARDSTSLPKLVSRIIRSDVDW